MNARTVTACLSFFVAACAVACSSSSPRSGFDTSSSSTDPNNPGNGGTFGGSNSDGGTAYVDPSSCQYQSGGDPNKDYDGDGYTLKDDCNECDPNTNKGAFDVPGNNVDEDCSGKADDEVTSCDDGLSIEGTDPFDGAKAIGLCKKATDSVMWGVISAKWVFPDGKAQTIPLSEGILPHFGVNKPQAGKSMLAISSGSARNPTDPGYHDVSGWAKGPSSWGVPTPLPCGTPSGYPKDSPSCGNVGDFGGANDGAALQVKIRVPSNAKSFKYQQNFFTYEFPEYICSNFNDFFVTMMTPKPANLPDGNIAFDQDGNPISVNNSFLQVCQKQSAGGKSFKCPLGNNALSGTGFEDHAASGWLTTTAPVDTLRGKELTLMWAIWDQGDGALDSTALIDDFAWSVEAGTTETAPTVVK